MSNYRLKALPTPKQQSAENHALELVVCVALLILAAVMWWLA